MHRLLVVFSCIGALLLSACEQGREGEQAGTLIGAAAGALLGREIGGGSVGMVVGAVAGAYLGGQLGKKLDRKDREAMERTTQQALTTSPPGTTSRWTNPDSGNSGTVTPQQSFTNDNGQECREFQQTVTVDSETQTAYGTACRQPDGTWRVVSG
ncbi:MAG: glycine zipper 2TM domain-containing protein [Alphaproteobacteria bacterium]|nr:MAG: glycine zipper 2TM domain-containing protein [Alphaproteobacteria bacterium]